MSGKEDGFITCASLSGLAHPIGPCDLEAPTLVDLFSGIGGFSLGLERAGYRTAAFCEISPKCRHLLNHHWPEVPCYDDVQTLTAERLASDGIGRVDAICGGFPCQDISLAGKGAGLAGKRSGLWSEYSRIIGELRPGTVFVENVAALLVRGMGTVLGDLAALGYDAWWDCIPASAVGAPHRRDRLWIVAYARGQQHEGYGDALRREIAAELPRAFARNTGVQDWADDQALAQCADADRLGSHRTGFDIIGAGEPGDEQERVAGSLGEVLADSSRLLAGRAQQRPKRQRVGARGQSIAVERADELRHMRPHDQIRSRRDAAFNAGWWLSEPDVGRVAHGVPARVDRLHGLGNAVVPEIPYRLGRAVLAAMSAERIAA